MASGRESTRFSLQPSSSGPPKSAAEGSSDWICVPIAPPESKWQYGQVRWMLLHEGISVYVDHDNDWYLEVQTRCGELTEKNLCRSYLERPKLCEEYSPERCQVWNPEPPSKMEFKTAD